jgi:glycosyltransferase involved in cell wall biosynthesis
VGQLIARKNVTSLVEAFRQIREPGDRLTIVGSGPERADLERQVREAGMTSAVRFLGSQEGRSLCRAYAEAHTLVLPSTNEVWGLVVNEALASDLQIVVSDACGVAAEVKGSRGVWVVAPAPDEIAAALKLTTTERILAEERMELSSPTPSLAATVLRAASA